MAAGSERARGPAQLVRPLGSRGHGRGRRSDHGEAALSRRRLAAARTRAVVDGIAPAASRPARGTGSMEHLPVPQRSAKEAARRVHARAQPR